MKSEIDHLIYTTPTLEEGINQIEQLLGVRPVKGGQHPQWGTHNALLSLGEDTYLEIIAPDPSLESPQQGRLFQNQYHSQSQLFTWALRTEQMELDYERANSRGLSLGAIESGQRKSEDGDLLSWKLTDPYALPMDGAIPFLISWGDTSHPSQTVQKGGEFVSLTIMHPAPELIKEKLDILEVYLDVQESETFHLKAKIKTLNGEVVILD